MRKRQWIWLVVAVVLFTASGLLSVVVNTWSASMLAESSEAVMDSLTSWAVEGDEAYYFFPEEEFIARLDVEGTIVSNGSAAAAVYGSGFDLDGLIDYVRALAACDSNRGILLYVNSGGGEMLASDELYLELMDYKEATGRPVWAYFDGTACSGAYYIAMAADEIYANRNCLCVNIGVYISTYNLSGLFEKYGVEQVLIRSSDNKGIGSIGVPWTEEQRGIYQSIVDLDYQQFLEVVADGRGMSEKLVRSLDDGREMLAAQALKAGFIDGIARCDDYVDSLLEQTGLILYEKPEPRNFSTLLDWIYGRLERLVPRTDGELLQEFADANEGITVMAYAG